MNFFRGIKYAQIVRSSMLFDESGYEVMLLH